MSSLLEQKLYASLQKALQSEQLDKAEQAISYLKTLKQIEEFVDRETDETASSLAQEQDHNKKSASVGLEPERKKPLFLEKKPKHPSLEKRQPVLFLYYLEDENILKFKKTTQTYTVSIEFFHSFLEHLNEWKNNFPFSSKQYYEVFADSLRTYTSYQSSTLRQFITLLFRYCHKMDLITKPDPPQRNLFYVKETIITDEVIDKIKREKVLQF